MNINSTNTSIYLRVLLLGTQMAVGGAQQVLLNLAGWLHRNDVSVQTAFLYDKEGLEDSWQKKYPFEVINLHCRPTKGKSIDHLIMLVAGWFRLLKLLRCERFDAIITFTHDSNLFALPAAWVAGIPVRIGSHHGRYPSLTRNLIRLHTSVINSCMVTSIVSVSNHTYDQAMKEGIHQSKIQVIFNGIDFSPCSRESCMDLRLNLLHNQKGPLILSVGRLVPPKDYSTLVDAAFYLLKKNPDVVFCVAGEGPLHEKLASQISTHDIGDHFFLLGNRTDVPRLLAASDIFIVSSSSEGLPIALLEAMSSGLPVISTRIGGVSDVITEGETGIFVQPGNAEEMADGLFFLINNQSLRKHIMEKGQARIYQDFSLNNMGENYLTLISKEKSPRALKCPHRVDKEKKAAL